MKNIKLVTEMIKKQLSEQGNSSAYIESLKAEMRLEHENILRLKKRIQGSGSSEKIIKDFFAEQLEDAMAKMRELGQRIEGAKRDMN